MAQGFLLTWEIVYYDPYVNVVGYNTLRTILSVSAVTVEQKSQVDIENAYVEITLDKDTE